MCLCVCVRASARRRLPPHPRLCWTALNVPQTVIRGKVMMRHSGDEKPCKYRGDQLTRAVQSRTITSYLDSKWNCIMIWGICTFISMHIHDNISLTCTFLQYFYILIIHLFLTVYRMRALCVFACSLCNTLWPVLHSDYFSTISVSISPILSPPCVSVFLFSAGQSRWPPSGSAPVFPGHCPALLAQ